MRKIIFSQNVLKRISEIKSVHFSLEETIQFQIKLIQSIHHRLSWVTSFEGYREYDKGPWANTRRVIILGYKVYYIYDQSEGLVKVRGIKPPRME